MKMLVATDGSKAAPRAVEYAAKRAGQLSLLPGSVAQRVLPVK